MPEPDPDLNLVLESLQELRREVARLGERVAALEGPATTESEAAAWSAVAGTAPRPEPPTPALDPDTLTAIAAAVAAYLGKEPHIRSVRLLRSSAWAQQGRATIQAWYSVSPPTTNRGAEVT